MKSSLIFLSDAVSILNRGFFKWKSTFFINLPSFIFLEDYRLWTKKIISRYLIDNTSFEMATNVLFFSFAFSQMVWFRYQEKSFSFFLQNTFPGVSLPCQTLSWDTFSTLFFNYDSLKLSKVDMYPNSLLIATESNKYFNQKLLDIGVLPLKKEASQNKIIIQSKTVEHNNPSRAGEIFVRPKISEQSSDNGNEIYNVSVEETGKHISKANKKVVGNLGSPWSSFFSSRLHSKFYLFEDEFPSKLDSTFYPFISETDTKVSESEIADFFLSDQKNEKADLKDNNFRNENILVFKLKKPFVLSDSVNRPSSIVSTKQNQFVSERNSLLNSTQTSKKEKELLKAVFTQKKNINFGKTNHTIKSKKLKFLQKKAFLSKEITTLSNQIGINPFSSLEKLFFSEKELDQNSASFNALSEELSLPLIESLSEPTNEELFFDPYSEDVLNAIGTLNLLKPSVWLEPKFRSGFLYPDNDNVSFLKNQLAYQKNLILRLYRKSSSLTPLRQDVTQNFNSTNRLMPNFFKQNKNISLKEPPVLPIEVTFHPNSSRSQMQDRDIFSSRSNLLREVKQENKKKPVFRFQYRPLSLIFENETYYEGGGLVKNKFTSDVDLSNKSEINKWAKKYFSGSNFLTDRKNSFFGYSPKKSRFISNKEEKIQEILVPDEFFKRSFFPRDSESEKLMSSKLKIDPNVQLPIPLLVESEYNTEYFNNLPVLLCNENWRIPYIKKDEWESIIKKAILESIEIPQNPKSIETDQSEEFSEISHRIELSVPLIRIALPTSRNLVNQPWPRTFIDYQPDSLQARFKELINPIDFTYHSLPWSRSQWTTDLVSQKHFGNLYKRETTIFTNLAGKKTQNTTSNQINLFQRNFPFFLETCFTDYWEPFTLNSWMILNQFCFVLFSLRVCGWCYQEYGKESLLYLIEFLESLGVVDENLKDDLQLGNSNKSFRTLKSINKRFKDVAGIDGILPDLSEIVWFLRNSGRSFKIGKVIPKGVLFVGPPGTGKTFLASAIAGEAEVPVLVQSGSTLSVPEKPGKGAERLKNLFSEARQLAPCIIFIDEIDTLGEKRQHVTGNPMGHDDIFEALDNKTASTNSFESLPEVSQSFASEGSKETLTKVEKQEDQLKLLTQFLVEMDGLESRQGIIVIGATNRPDVLDPAFTRPGRFDQIIKLEFPAKQKRIEILKLYSKNLGIESQISWNYLASRTDGCSAADLSAAMNESSIQAILKDTTHTVETIEQGLDFVQSSTREKPYFRKKNQLAFAQAFMDQPDYDSNQASFSQSDSLCEDPFFLKRLAYSQAGKAVLFTLLPQHPPCIFLNLWAPLQYTKSQNKLRKSDSVLKPFSTRFQLENILIGFYAAKASELLILFQNSNSASANKNYSAFLRGISSQPKNFGSPMARQNSVIFPDTLVSETLFQKEKSKFSSTVTLWESDLNREDIRQGTLLAQSMISKWYFYSKKISYQKVNSISTNQNDEDISFLKNLTVQTEESTLDSSEKNWQKVSLRAWWQNTVTYQTGALNAFSGDWYRIYLSDPEQSLRNEEFVPSDEYYHNEERSLNLLQHSKKSSLYWNDLYKNHRDSLYQALVMNSFNKAFSLLDKNREIIDSFADYLLRYETIRENEISSLFLNFKQI